MHVWVLETFQRDDKFCEYNSNIVAIYSKSNYRKARKHFTELCKSNILDNEENGISRWRNEKGFFFSSELHGHNGFTMNYVGLRKMEVI